LGIRYICEQNNSNNQKFNLELVRETLNITESKFDSEITNYPIPAKDSFTISGLNSGDKRQIKIINMLGETLKNIETSQDNYIVDTSNIRSGIYIVIISSERNETIMKRVLIN
jgi:hypothetical protein